MLIVANWKAYVASKEKAKKLFALAKKLSASRKVKLALAVPAPYIGLFAKGNTSGVALAAQDVSDVMDATETGETIAPLLRDLGVKYVLVGHSERRARGETDAVIAQKVKRALVNGITPILCVGERERDEGARYLALIRAQIESAFTGLSPKERLAVIIAYEPIWAIGKTSDDAIQPTDLQEMILYIRKVLGELMPGRAASQVKIIYGGSAEPENVKVLARASGVAGFLPGHASVDPAMFAKLVKALS